MALRDTLEQRGVFGSVFCPPATPRTRSLIRLSLHAALTDTQVAHLITTCLDPGLPPTVVPSSIGYFENVLGA
ncbi:hypothetical protein [Streptomyces sp. H27-S2]|uniref:hypothetical protein n=1 Tax=Streptomyces antarcticus TaxID=2996458 RepID=UPI00226FC2E6|nr:hypothetical protein [Streptomyces sp. H27-S2]MCY0951387.1 hypothetical protein [Streptomyces sp. H27-S2]